MRDGARPEGTRMGMKLEQIPLRARKRAKTRQALMAALATRLAERPLSDISASELAADAEVSTATFFNYFPSKEALLVYFVQMWSLRMHAMARVIQTEHDSALSAIEALFVTTGGWTAVSPNIMLEIIAQQARGGQSELVTELEEADRLIFLPDDPDPMSLHDKGLGAILTTLITEAIARGELPQDTDVQTALLGAASIFFGIPLLLGRTAPEAIVPMYRTQLAYLWAGLQQQGDRS
ncbi:MAG: TetR/AcrR family transcriptional regulator [Myxococcota bacterium]